MLNLLITIEEGFDDSTQEFIDTDVVPLQLEHSLVSLSKWESIHEKPFLSKEPKTPEETLSYIRCMNVGPDFPIELLGKLSDQNLVDINNYINRKMTATWFAEAKTNGQTSMNQEIITAEIIYYWMVSLQIPFEPTQHWHLERLLTLVKVCDHKNRPQKKMSRREVAQRYHDLNAKRRHESGSKG